MTANIYMHIDTHLIEILFGLQATVPSYIVSDFAFSFLSLRWYLDAKVCCISGERASALPHRVFSCKLISCHRILQLCCSSLLEVSCPLAEGDQLVILPTVVVPEIPWVS